MTAAIAAIGAVVIAAALLYAPVSNGGFLWDDKTCLHDSPALRVGETWKHYLLRDFCDWTNYFRPLTVAFFTIQVRAFDALPGPMHVVSLVLHLANSLLVGLLCVRLAKPRARPMAGWLALIAVLAYAFHPALIEPVAWIGCQADLLATFFILLGLIGNTATRLTLRVPAVAVAFLCAASAKESALALPPLLLVVDLVLERDGPRATWSQRLRAMARQQGFVYAGVFVAGIVYLTARRWALGTLVNPAGDATFFSFAHLQEISQVYVSYLRLIVWPASGLNPIHPQQASFEQVTPTALLADGLALAIAGAGLYLSVWKRHPIGYCIVAVTAALLPVLHIIPVRFDDSLYHERYAINAIAAACALLPLTLQHALPAPSRWRAAIASMFAAWLVLSAVNVRVTLPLWSNDVLVWQWALAANPGSTLAKDRLLTAYMEAEDHRRARQLADAIIAGGEHCPSCLLNAANLAISEGNVSRADALLQRLRDEPKLADDPQFLRIYLLAIGGLSERQGDLPAAESAYRQAFRVDRDPVVASALAIVLAKKGDLVDARQLMSSALERLPPDEREQRSRAFEAAVAGSASGAQH